MPDQEVEHEVDSTNVISDNDLEILEVSSPRHSTEELLQPQLSGKAGTPPRVPKEEDNSDGAGGGEGPEREFVDGTLSTEAWECDQEVDKGDGIVLGTNIAEEGEISMDEGRFQSAGSMFSLSI